MPVEAHREEQMIVERSVDWDGGVRLAPGQRRNRAGKSLVQGHAFTGQIEIDFKTREKIGSEQPVERLSGRARHRQRPNEDPEVREGRPAKAEASQSRIAAGESAIEAAHVPRIFVVSINAEPL